MISVVDIKFKGGKHVLGYHESFLDNKIFISGLMIFILVLGFYPFLHNLRCFGMDNFWVLGIDLVNYNVLHLVILIFL